MDRYTGHSSALSFKAHEKDAEMFELKFADQKAREKHLKMHQSIYGAVRAGASGKCWPVRIWTRCW